MTQKVLFIGGLGRSGSTLVESLLNELPQTIAVGETVHLWERGLRDQERCGCGLPFAQCEHWTQVGATAFGGWDKLDLDRIIDLRWSVDRSRRLPQILRSLRNGVISSDQQVYLDHLRAVLLASAEVAGGPEIILESSKHLSTAALLSLDPALDVRVLHLVRDPRGVAYSWTKQVKRPEADDQLMPVYKPSRTAGRWVSDNLGFQRLAAEGIPTLTLRYEDFLAEPAATLTFITQLMGLDQPVDFPFLDGNRAQLSTPMHSIAGNPLRFGSDELVLRLDDAWKTKLDPSAQRVVTTICRPVLGRFGYKR